jgi:phosphoribosylaminoimidazole-succinocarboxamide synthase
MVKNQRLAANVITPTTKSEDHDEPISPSEIISKGLMSKEDWEAASSAALALFNFGQQEAAKRGLLLVDTKYEFGKTADGRILLIDEVGCDTSQGEGCVSIPPAKHRCPCCSDHMLCDAARLCCLQCSHSTHRAATACTQPARCP